MQLATLFSPFSLQALREFREETGVPLENLRDDLSSLGVYAYFHPELSSSGSSTITLCYVFRIDRSVRSEELFQKNSVMTGETRACFLPLKELTCMPLRSCPLASLRAAFSEHISFENHQIIDLVLKRWHVSHKSKLLGNVLEEAAKRGRWIRT